MANPLKKGTEKMLPVLQRLQQLQAEGYSPDEARTIASQEFGFKVSAPSASGLGKVAGGVGDVVKHAAPLATFIPGVGPAAAAGLSALGGVAGKLNDPGGLKGTKVLKDIGLPAALTFGAAKALDKFGGAGGPKVTGTQGTFVGGVPIPTFGDKKSGIGGVIDSVLGALTNKDSTGNAGLSLLGKLLLGGGASALALKDASSQRKSAEQFTQAQLDLQRKGLETAEKDLESRAPLKQAGMAKLTSRQPNDIFTGFMSQPSAARKQLRDALLNAKAA